MLNIAFVCVHNSCRSQMAEAITNLKYNDYFNAYSAGTEIVNNINPDIPRDWSMLEVYKTIIKANIRQWCEAILRATGKWKD